MRSGLSFRVALVGGLSAALILGGAQLPAVSATPAGVATAAAAAGVDEVDSDDDGTPDRPNADAASQAARRLDKRVEDLSQRTPQTRVFANADGTWTTEAAAGPVAAQDADTGLWEPIDTTLALANGEWQPKSAVGDLRFSSGGDGPLAEMTGTDGSRVSWSWPTELPEPSIDGSTLTYPNVVPQGDLVVEALPDGFSHSVVLRAPPSDPSFDIPMFVETDGGKLTERRDGSLTVSDAGEGVVAAPQPTMWDTGVGPVGEPTTAPVETEVTRVDGQTSLVLKPDAAFLSDPDTVYPVTIDPTWTTVSYQTATVINGGSALEFDWNLQAGNDGTNDYAGAVTFDQSAFSGNITAATLSLYAKASSDCSPLSLTVQRVIDGWQAPNADVSAPEVTSDGAAVATQSAKGGPTGCSTRGWDTWNVTDLAQDAASGGESLTLLISATNSSSTGWRLYDSPVDYAGSAPNLPTISITGDGAPKAARWPTPSDSRYWNGGDYTRTATPAWSTSASDPDGGSVRYTTEVHATNSEASPVVASCTTGYVASGSESSCTPATPLADGAYYVRSRADDGSLSGPWSALRKVTVNYDQPEPVTTSCTNAADGRWYDTRPVNSTVCTFTSPGAVQLEWTVNGVAQTALTANGAGSATTGPIVIPAAGWTDIKVRGVSNSGLASAWKTHAFGTGTAWITGPTSGAGSATSFTFAAAAAAGASSAKLQYQNAASQWVDATAVKTANGATWSGTVESTPYLSTMSGVSWTPVAEAQIAAPRLLQTRVIFTYPSGTTRTSQTLAVQLNAHDFTTAAPTAAVGPGQVSLSSGEFQTSAVDASIGGLSVARSHLSNAAAATGVAGVFGPGWSASLAVGGPATYAVVDQRASTAAFLFQTPDGITYAYRSTSPAASNLGGVFVAQGDAGALGASVSLDPASGTLTYTEKDGTRTTFEQRGGKWTPTATIGTGTESTTSYSYTGDGLPSWIIAPTPTGVTCTPTSLPVGCKALQLTYTTTSGGAKRVASVVYQAWDPKLADGDAGDDGLPDSDAGISAVTVAKYAYTSGGTLQAVWDPRVADGAAALKTTYEYAIVGSKTRLTKVTPPGLKPWQINYDADGAVTSVTRAQDAAVSAGTATWTVRYGLALNAEGDGLPNLSGARTATWGQPGADAPEAAAAVFGPDRVPAATPTVDDWTYADLYYWNAAGRLTNTASFGANAWQIASSRYNSRGGEVWTLSPAAKAKAITDGAGNAANSAAAADRYASQTLYSSDGRRAEATYGPTIEAQIENGSVLQLRSITQYVYDDEADASLTPGRPTTNVPDGGFGVVAEIRTSATDEASPGAWAIDEDTPTDTAIHLYDTKRTRYRYDPAVTGDPNGWPLRQPTQVKLQNGSGWDSTVYRYDSSGRAFQTRTPGGAATDTVYYTADSSASRTECRGKPAWAGLTCWTGPASQPATGQAIPTTSFTGYALDDAPTRSVTSGGSAAKAEVIQYDAAGRPIRSATTITGTAGEPVAATTNQYSATTGLQTTTGSGATTLTTGYDTWGRVTSQTDGAGNTATTTFTPGGQVASVNDGKGTYTYTYNQSGERRDLPVTQSTGIAGTNLTGTYDASGALAKQVYPSASGYGLTETRIHDLAGSLTYLNFASDSDEYVSIGGRYDVGGRLRQTDDNTHLVAYGYDDRGRLTNVADREYNTCFTRTYELSADSNRTALNYYNPAANGTCQSTTPGVTRSSTYDSADRATASGYAYDDLGRTTTVAAADTSGSANLSVGYYANDMVANLSQGTKSQTYTLDPLGRISTTKNLTSGVSLVETTNHYTDTGDSPAWTETKTRPDASTAWTTTWTRYVRGLDGKLAIIQSSTGTPKIATYNIHGDVISTIGLGAGYWDAFTHYNEFGGGGSSTNRYGWLGSAQRDSQGLGGLMLMGSRLYNPMTGRFLTRDPVPGGSDNAYVYPADPINKLDLNGKWSLWKAVKAVVSEIGQSALKSWISNMVGGAVCTPGLALLCGALVDAGIDFAWTLITSVMSHASLTLSITAAVVSGFGTFVAHLATGGLSPAKFFKKHAGLLLKGVAGIRLFASKVADFARSHGLPQVASAIITACTYFTTRMLTTYG